MAAITTTRYVCDSCQKDIQLLPYGPLVVEISAPHFWSGHIRGHFCKPECACAWLNGRALNELSGNGPTEGMRNG